MRVRPRSRITGSTNRETRALRVLIVGRLSPCVLWWWASPLTGTTVARPLVVARVVGLVIVVVVVRRIPSSPSSTTTMVGILMTFSHPLVATSYYRYDMERGREDPPRDLSHSHQDFRFTSSWSRVENPFPLDCRFNGPHPTAGHSRDGGKTSGLTLKTTRAAEVLQLVF